MDSTLLSEKIKSKLSSYLNYTFSKGEISKILKEMNSFLSYEIILEDTENKLLYSDLEKQLFNINEKQTQRKEKGVYYTDNDVTEFIIDECITNRDKTTFLAGSIFDPTCGSGEFLLTALKKKVTINNTLDVKWEIKDIIKTIYGNDLNPESISITKLRLFLFILNEYGIKYINNIGKILNKNFSSEDFLSYSNTCKYDFIIGNPPYVETRGTTVFGNLYADILNNVCNYSSDNGVIGFIIPLSYISTPRMNKIRSRISEIYNSQYLYNYADRPGCLFTQVHQKLTILIACKTKEKQISTGNYQYWYNEEREELFKNKKIIINPFGNEKFIPKLGTIEDKTVYEKIQSNTTSLSNIILDPKKNEIEKKPCLYLNMRAAFWIKAFLTKHSGNEYKQFAFETESYRDFFYCLVNSSLFWWFWICVSDCWHITNKEFDSFKIPDSFDSSVVKQLAKSLERQLEQTKKFVGTKQTDYEYKHKNCLKEIHAIDDYINKLFGLNNNENNYIKNYSLIYRTSGGIAKCV